MAGQHFIVKCQHCGTVLAQCRCPAPDKTVSYGRCAICAKVTLELGAVVSDATGREWICVHVSSVDGKHFQYTLALIPRGETREALGRTWFATDVERRVVRDTPPEGRPS
jgi:hypothetical protein